MTASRLCSAITGKNVAFITVKNRDYIRVSQIERMLSEYADSFIIVTSEKGNPLTRALDLKKRMNSIDFSKADVVIAGFLPQLIIKDIRRGMGKIKRLGKDEQTVIVSEFFLSLYDTIALDRKLVKKSGIIAGLLKKLDKQAIDEADLVITDTNADAQFLASEYDADIDKFETLYLEADSDLYNTESCEKTLEDKAVIKNDVKVLYFGTGLPLQGTDVVLGAFLQAVKKDSELRCTYIGGTKGIPGTLLEEASGCPQIEMLSWVSQKELADRIKCADLCIAGHFNQNIDKADRTIPGKAFIYEVMEKPIILGDTKANHELFNEDERHFFVPRGDKEALCEKILEFCKRTLEE